MKMSHWFLLTKHKWICRSSWSVCVVLSQSVYCQWSSLGFGLMGLFFSEFTWAIDHPSGLRALAEVLLIPAGGEMCSLAQLGHLKQPKLLRYSWSFTVRLRLACHVWLQTSARKGTGAWCPDDLVSDETLAKVSMVISSRTVTVWTVSQDNVILSLSYRLNVSSCSAV